MRRFTIVDGEHVAGHDDTCDVVERFAKDREAGEFGLHHELARFFEGGGIANRDDVGPRSHHVAHALVAEFNDGFDQPRFVLLDDAFFGGGVDEGFDGLLLIGGGSGGFAIFGKVQDGNQQLQHSLHRPNQKHESAHDGHKGQNPIPRAARQ